MRSGKRLVVVVNAVVLSLIGGAVAFGSIPASNGTITACYDKSTKVLRVIDAAKETCKQNEQTISWSQTGPAGSQGSIGPQGATGLQGPSGPTGPEGVKGETGSQGPVGPDGDLGPAGPAGSQGETGPQGSPGTALAYARVNAFGVVDASRSTGNIAVAHDVDSEYRAYCISVSVPFHVVSIAPFDQQVNSFVVANVGFDTDLYCPDAPADLAVLLIGRSDSIRKNNPFDIVFN